VFYKVDNSYANGSKKYMSDSLNIDWDALRQRGPGEDPESLAAKVVSANLTKQDNPKLNRTNIWEQPVLVREINTRYAECLLNDVANPDRGVSNARVFKSKWSEMKVRVDEKKALPTDLSCEFIARIFVVPNEGADQICNVHPAAPLPALGYHSHATGLNARARRDAKRLAEQAAAAAGHHAEPPPRY
jgi:hypothetical protein